MTISFEKHGMFAPIKVVFPRDLLLKCGTGKDGERSCTCAFLV